MDANNPLPLLPFFWGEMFARMLYIPRLQAELLSEKEKFATLNGGVPYDPPKPAKKAKGPAQTPAPQRAPGEKSKKVRGSPLETERRRQREKGLYDRSK